MSHAEELPTHHVAYTPCFRRERFECAYPQDTHGRDQVGNRTRYTQTLTNTVVTVYAYPQDAQGRDAANRLTSVNGQAYTWDNNLTPLRFGDWCGNLLDDGSKTYTYPQDAHGRDHANRLTNISATVLTWSATYNGDDARRKQTANGVVTIYTLDLAAPLVTVLARHTGAAKPYVYGTGTPLTRAGRPLAHYG